MPAFSRGDVVKRTNKDGTNNYGTVCGAFYDLSDNLIYFCQVHEATEFMFFLGTEGQLEKVTEITGKRIELKSSKY